MAIFINLLGLMIVHYTISYKIKVKEMLDENVIEIWEVDINDKNFESTEKK